jgi:long-subunit acyl-CoA synthetase (AMP-forming)
MNNTIDFLRVFDLVGYQLQKYPQPKALSYFEDGNWKSYSAQEIQQKVNTTSCWLINNGFVKGDCIAIIPRM